MRVPSQATPVASATFGAGSAVYALEPGTGVSSSGWLPATVTTAYPNGLAQVRGTDGKVFNVRNDAGNLLPASKEAAKGIPDIINLDVLHEGAIQESIWARYQRNEIYTYVGPLLISVNPYTPLPLYTRNVVDAYIEGRTKAPHLYSIAHRAYENIERGNTNQSILISGESGAGKTEATKIVLQYLTELSVRRQNATSQGENAHITAQQRILDANPVLEAFGNAKTVRNNNSSRFGKFFQVQFDGSNRIIGATIIKYLLEKSRVVSHGPDERSYHIFYQLCAGASEAERNQLGLGAAEDFYYLVQSGSCGIDGVDDAQGFQGVRNAFSVLGFTEPEVLNILKCLAAILHLGNVDFETSYSSDSANAHLNESDGRSAWSLNKVADLLAIDPERLHTSLVQRTMAPGAGNQGTACNIPLDCAGALDSRDALAKEIYNTLFDWLVRRINEAMDRSSTIAKSISVLDIFGFEVLQTNSFEQLCINYANEKLHQQFVNNYFKAELAEYKAEGVAVDFIQFRDNAACLALIEKKPLGVLALLHEECCLRNCTDASFVAKLNTSLRSTGHFLEQKLNPLQFGVQHYAGDVVYDAVSFLEKNKDLLHADIQDLMRSSQSSFVRLLFQGAPAGAGKPPGRATHKSMVTVAGQFKEQVEALTMLLKATQCHYIRCIKPNDAKAAACFSGGLVLLQLQYSGVLESVHIRRAGYSARFDYNAFTARWFPLAIRRRQPSNLRAWTRAICEAAGVSESFYAFGTNKVFFKHPDVVTHLDNHRDYTLATRAVKIQVQAAYRGWWRRRWWRRLRGAVCTLQRVARGFLSRRRTQHLRALQRQAALRQQQEQQRQADLAHQQGRLPATVAAAVAADRSPASKVVPPRANGTAERTLQPPSASLTTQQPASPGTTRATAAAAYASEGGGAGRHIAGHHGRHNATIRTETPDDAAAAAAAPPPGPAVLRSGWLLMELFEPYHKWKLRFCVLTPGRIMFYTSSDCTDPCGSLPLPSTAEVQEDLLHRPDPTYAFVFVAQSALRAARLAAATATNQREWVASIAAARADAHAPNAQPPGPAVAHLGWLHMQDRARWQWRRRFFVLRGGWLTYYLDERCADCVGELSLRDGLHVRLVRAGRGAPSPSPAALGWDTDHVMVLNAGRRELALAADDDLDTLEQWAHALNVHARGSDAAGRAAAAPAPASAPTTVITPVHLPPPPPPQPRAEAPAPHAAPMLRPSPPGVAAAAEAPAAASPAAEDVVHREGWVVVSRCLGEVPPPGSVPAARLTFAAGRILHTDIWKQRYAVVAGERVVFYMDSMKSVRCEELILLGGGVEVLGEPSGGLEAQPKFVRLQSHILKLSMVARMASGDGGPAGAARGGTLQDLAATTVLVGTSIAREASAWEAALLEARDAAERALIPAAVPAAAPAAETASQLDRLRPPVKMKLFANAENGNGNGNINGAPKGSPDGGRAPPHPVAMSLPTATAYHRTAAAAATSTPAPTMSPHASANHHLLMSPDVTELIGEVMQQNPGFSSRNDALRAVLQQQLQSPSPATAGYLRAGAQASPSPLSDNAGVSANTNRHRPSISPQPYSSDASSPYHLPVPPHLYDVGVSVSPLLGRRPGSVTSPPISKSDFLAYYRRSRDEAGALSTALHSHPPFPRNV